MDETTAFITEALIKELSDIVNGCKSFQRLRLAVSPDEFAALQQYFLEKDGKFWFRFRDVPLVVEEIPIHPPYKFTT